MITSSCNWQDIKVDDIVINKFNFIDWGHFYKYRVTGFETLTTTTGYKFSLVNGIRVKWDNRHKEWVSFGREQTLHTCYRPSKDEIVLLER